MAIKSFQDLNQALRHFKKLLHENPDWDFRYCANKIADWHKIQVGYLISEYTKARAKKKRVKRVKSSVGVGKDGYPKDAPWWIKN